jgi:hypothetical protein
MSAALARRLASLQALADLEVPHLARPLFRCAACDRWLRDSPERAARLIGAGWPACCGDEMDIPAGGGGGLPARVGCDAPEPCVVLPAQETSGAAA